MDECNLLYGWCYGDVKLKYMFSILIYFFLVCIFLEIFLFRECILCF